MTHAQLLGVAVPLATVSSVSAFAQHRRAPVLLWSLGGVALLGSGETFGHAVGVAGSLLVASGQWRSQYVISKINECCEDCYVHRASAAVRKRAQLLLTQAALRPRYSFLGRVPYEVVVRVTLLQLALATVDPKDELIAYRVSRSSSLIWMYSTGAWSKDAVVNHLTGFEDPMRLFQFVTNFGLAMWSIDTWAKVPISLK